MTRLAFNRILLSLLLLFSQQMALSHALSHVTATFSALQAHAAAVDAADLADSDSDLSNAIAQDKSCHQCLAFAQLFGPAGEHPARLCTARPARHRAGHRAVRRPRAAHRVRVPLTRTPSSLTRRLPVA